MFDKPMMRGLLAAALLASAVTVQASTINVFNMPSGETSLTFVPVGNVGNIADPTGSHYGSVGYNYNMGTYDVTAAQYTQFLTAVATTSDPYGLYNASMAVVGASSYGCGIVRGGAAGSYTYTVAMAYQNFPVNWVSWGDAARFCNWLQNGQLTAPEGNGTTETGSYNLGGGTSQAALMAVTRSSTANYVIPTENEWYKASYYVGGGTNAGYWLYPTKSNLTPSNLLVLSGTNNANFSDAGYWTDPSNGLTPVGAFVDCPGPYGTYDMGGDVYQWTEGSVSGSYRVHRGGSFGISSAGLTSGDREYDSPTQEASFIGVRVASLSTPEPASLALLLAGGSCLAAFAWRRRRRSLSVARDSTLSSDDETAPAILSMPSRWTEAARKAA